MYLIYGNCLQLIEEKINEIVANGLNIIKVDMKETSLADVLEEASYLSLFDEQKYVVIKNAHLFGSKKALDNEIDSLFKYLNNPNPNSTLVFVTDQKLDERKKIVKEFRKNFQVIEIPDLDEASLAKKVSNEFSSEGYKISRTSIFYILKSCLNNYDLIYQEIIKLKLFAINDKVLSDEDVIKGTSVTLDNDIFKFTNAVIKKNIKDAFEILENLKNMKQEPIVLLVVLANQYRLMYQTKYLNKRGLNQGEIAKELKINPNVIWHALQNSYNYSFEELLNKLENIADLDFSIKSGAMDRFHGLDSFLLNV